MSFDLNGLNSTFRLEGVLDQCSTNDAAILASPGVGRSLAATANHHGKFIRQAIADLQRQLEGNKCKLDALDWFDSRWLALPTEVVRTSEELLASALVATWVSAYSGHGIGKDAGIPDALQWFFGNSSVDRINQFCSGINFKTAEELLRSAGDEFTLRALLPYVLDPHDVGSRLSVRRRPETVRSRITKKAQGVFYTPADVASYMADKALPSAGAITVFDPCCGTGVFLKACLQKLKNNDPHVPTADLATRYLFGADIDPWVLAATTFVLLVECVRDKPVTNTPAILWHRIRINFVCSNFLSLASTQNTSEHRLVHIRMIEQLDAGILPSPIAQSFVASVKGFSDAFPALSQGPEVCIANPPYRTVELSVLGSLQMHFQTLVASKTGRAEAYPAFIELCLKLLHKEHGRLAVVTPLSFACGSGPQFRVLREIVKKSPGRWRFAFFDREPHALFGEEAKTRNTIAFYERQEGVTEVNTGPLQKWRAPQRDAMFRNIVFTPVSGDLNHGLPKLEGQQQRTAYDELRNIPPLERSIRKIQGATFDECFEADDITVFVGSTAYNFLNVFLRPNRPETSGTIWSVNALHAIACSSPADAHAVYALLSSRLAFWWWHVHGDGFHVTRNILQSVPCPPDVFQKGFTNLGRMLWENASSAPIVSLNKARTSIAFHASGSRLQNLIDDALVQANGLDHSFAQELENFMERTVSSERRRDHMDLKVSAA